MVTKFACKSIPGTGVRSGAFFTEEERIELIEIYQKNQRENHNEKLIKELYLYSEANQKLKATFSK